MDILAIQLGRVSCSVVQLNMLTAVLVTLWAVPMPEMTLASERDRVCMSCSKQELLV